jgi:hypothetical protein
MTLNPLDIGDIQASSRKTIGAVSKTPIENRGPASQTEKRAESSSP